MRILDRGLIYDATAAPLERQSCALTSLIALGAGSYRCAFRAAPGRDIPGGKLRIMGSANGRDWETVHLGLSHRLDGIEGDVYAGYFAELEPRILTGAFVWVDRSNPDLSFVNPETAGVLEMRNLLATSVDGGASWHNWRELDLGPEEGCSCTGPIFEAAPGVLGFPYETWKSYDDPRPGVHTASLRLSYDGGLTWNERDMVAADPLHRLFFWITIAVQPESGERGDVLDSRPERAPIRKPHLLEAPHGRGLELGPASTVWPGRLPAHCTRWRPLAAVHPNNVAGRIVGASLTISPHLARRCGPAYLHHQPDRPRRRLLREFWQSMMTWPFGIRAGCSHRRVMCHRLYAGPTSHR